LITHVLSLSVHLTEHLRLSQTGDETLSV